MTRPRLRLPGSSTPPSPTAGAERDSKRRAPRVEDANEPTRSLGRPQSEVSEPALFGDVHGEIVTGWSVNVCENGG